MGEDSFSSTNTLTQTKIYVKVSNNPAIAIAMNFNGSFGSGTKGTPGKAVCVVESIFT